MADAKFVWPKNNDTEPAHIVEDPFVPQDGKAGIKTYCGLWWKWGDFTGFAVVPRPRCTACLKGFMADNVMINDAVFNRR